MGKLIGLALILLLIADSAAAWGARGHHIISVVAARLLAEDVRTRETLGLQLLEKEYLVSHVSNLPDVSWRNGDPEIKNKNWPTHFVDIEYLADPKQKLDVKLLPRTMAEFKKAISTNCKQKSPCPSGEAWPEKLRTAGHLSLRIEQLSDRLLDSFKNLARKRGKGEFPREATATVDEILVRIGLLSHFVGDISNPLHTSINYNGQLSQQAGIHSYFEEHVVNALDLDLIQKVFKQVRNSKPFESQIKDRHQPKDTLDIIHAYGIESHKSLEMLLGIDRKYSILELSGPMKRSKRRPAHEVAKHYEAYTVQQLSLASDVLKHLILEAWLKAGQPSLAGYRSYFFPLDVDYIPADYLK
ncbi:hypothetical protein [Pseudobacteriovorax antillogorgiicola]|uniref:S1/P1 Nuclease n=1 Tax=Pseudobacteriovorax antillogorgiicola TaxID=1513793 RepID=A0A1Y6BIB0_9BACT|nr:hypothetical protein [Pseudobacteriovorax antillogorgiicola]TCS57318.1 S1/P1 nuclease [Pseudobacteriovorax antillogorgiicola]SMF02589.1 S1/P1 Nuclease [Pseudobacteriovorax antillogorgiicola]